MDDVIGALGLPADSVLERAPGGASGAAWRVTAGATRYALRMSGSVAEADARLAAMDAARSAGLAAPELAARATTAAGEALLLSWLPGTTMLEVMSGAPADAPHWGRRMGVLQRRLHDVTAPGSLTAAVADRGHPFGAGAGLRGLPEGDRLLHLDWHPMNLLVDAVSGEITGIVDWDNARRGNPLLDLARTHSILTLEPALDALPASVRARLPAFVEAWAAGYGIELATIPAACQLWAARVMLADLEPRHALKPAALDPVRRAIERWAAVSARPRR